MSIYQAASVGVVALIAGQIIVSAILPDPPAIEFESLTYAHGMVTVNRVVNSEEGDLYTDVSTKVVDMATGKLACKGFRRSNLTPGHRVGQTTLAEWVGEPEFGFEVCDADRLPPSNYGFSAVYVVGIEQYFVEGVPFTLPEAAGRSGR